MNYEVQQTDLQAQPTAVVRGHVTRDGIGDFLGRAFGNVMAAVAEQGLDITGAPFGFYGPPDDDGFDVEAGFPVSGAVLPAGDVEASELPGGTCAKTLHVGAYDKVSGAYEALSAWVIDNGQVPAGPAWESYLDPPEVDEPRTAVFLPYGAAGGGR